MSASGRSRAAALALFVGIVVVIGAALVVPAALYWSKTGAIIKEARAKTQNSERRADATQTLDNTRTAWNDFVASSASGFVLSDTDQAGISETTERISALFLKFDGTLTALSGTPAEGARAGVNRLNISGSGVLPRSSIGAFLTELESVPAYLVLSELKATVRGKDNIRLSFLGSAYRLMEPDV